MAFDEYDPTPVRRLVTARTKKIFGIPITRRGFSTFASGLTAQAPPDSGFLGGLAAGFAGAVGGAQRFDAQTHEQEREQLKAQAEERRLANMEARTRQYEQSQEAYRSRLSQPQAPRQQALSPYESTKQRLQAQYEFGQEHPQAARLQGRTTTAIPRQTEADKKALARAGELGLLPEEVRRFREADFGFIASKPDFMGKQVQQTPSSGQRVVEVLREIQTINDPQKLLEAAMKAPDLIVRKAAMRRRGTLLGQ